MVTRVRQEHILLTILLAVLWPIKVFFVYFWGCLSDITSELAKEWASRKKYTGWDR